MNVTYNYSMSASKHSRKMINRVLELAEELKSDPDRRERLEQQLCLACYYHDKHYGRIAGQAFTTVECGRCDKPMTFPTTAIDIVCGDCAKETYICVRCAADIDLQVIRKWWPHNHKDLSILRRNKVVE